MLCIPSDVCYIKSQTVQVSNSGIKQLRCAETDRTEGGDHSQRQSYLFSATETKIFRARSGTKVICSMGEMFQSEGIHLPFDERTF